MTKQIKQFIAYGLVLVAVAGLAWWLANSNEGAALSDSPPASAYSSSVLAVPENYYDFQTISMMDGNVEHDYVLTNNGTEPLIIEKAVTSCMCTEVLIIDARGKEYGPYGMPGHGSTGGTNVSVGAGDQVTVRAIFDPAAHGPSGVGLARRYIYLDTNSATSPKTELSFQAMVTK